LIFIHRTFDRVRFADDLCFQAMQLRLLKLQFSLEAERLDSKFMDFRRFDFACRFRTSKMYFDIPLCRSAWNDV
jgi:hypothetical protein